MQVDMSDIPDPELKTPDLISQLLGSHLLGFAGGKTLTWKTRLKKHMRCDVSFVV
jgi:hypothetical protein